MLVVDAGKAGERMTETTDRPTLSPLRFLSGLKSMFSFGDPAAKQAEIRKLEAVIQDGRMLEALNDNAGYVRLTREVNARIETLRGDLERGGEDEKLTRVRLEELRRVLNIVPEGIAKAEAARVEVQTLVK